MTTIDLKVGDCFRIKGKRKYLKVHRIIYFSHATTPYINNSYWGKYLVILSNCRQMILESSTELELKPFEL
jgi:hypothetical protein